MPLDFWTGLLVLGASCLAAAVAIFAQLVFVTEGKPTKGGIFHGDPDGLSFIFDGEALLDSSPKARALLASSPIRGGHWARLLAFLQPRFPQVEQALQQLVTDGSIRLSNNDPLQPMTMVAEHVGGLTRIAILNKGSSIMDARVDPVLYGATVEELDLLRTVIRADPNLIWQENGNGDVVWANNEHLNWVFRASPDSDGLGWPLKRLFATNSGHAESAQPLRRALKTSKNETFWFEISKHQCAENSLFFASSVDSVLRAEATLQSLMQVLTKSFAQLPTGLAIFDDQRRLQLFNPALADLTGLPIDFLSARPSLLAVLDALRDLNMLPEPKDYPGWRSQVSDMERTDATGQYQDTWNLPDGQTYRVIGRPHPNGALALMIEDISTEITRTRRYRDDLELGQSVIDEINTPLAVFAPSGQLVMSNTAYLGLWRHDPGENLEGSTVRNLSIHWRSETIPSALWNELEDYVGTVGDRTSWQAETRLTDGRMLECRFSPLPGGATLAVFRPGDVAEGEAPRLAEEQALKSA